MNVPEKHRAIAHAWVDGAQVEGRDLEATCPVPNEWRSIKVPVWLEDWEYRIKLTKSSINWEHVAPEYVALATDSDGNSFIYMGIPEAAADMWTAACPCKYKSAEAFQSFVKGTCDWKDSLVLRPSADSEKDAEDAAPSPTTTHTPTPKLEWSKTLAGGEPLTFAEAEQAVAELGEGWRLPTLQELESILDLSRFDPCINTAEFPDTISALYWSATPCAWNTSAHWAVSFYRGTVTAFGIDNAYVRAVREVATHCVTNR